MLKQLTVALVLIGPLFLPRFRAGHRTARPHRADDYRRLPEHPGLRHPHEHYQRRRHHGAVCPRCEPGAAPEAKRAVLGKHDAVRRRPHAAPEVGEPHLQSCGR